MQKKKRTKSKYTIKKINKIKYRCMGQNYFFPWLKLFFCFYCVLGKQKRKHYIQFWLFQTTLHRLAHPEVHSSDGASLTVLVSNIVLLRFSDVPACVHDCVSSQASGTVRSNFYHCILGMFIEDGLLCLCNKSAKHLTRFIYTSRSQTANLFIIIPLYVK